MVRHNLYKVPGLLGAAEVRVLTDLAVCCEPQHFNWSGMCVKNDNMSS